MAKKEFATEESFNTYKKLTNSPEDKELVYVKDIDKHYIYVAENNEWEQFEPVEGNLNITEYELAKTAIAQLPTYNIAQLERAKALIQKFKETMQAKYYMLLNRDLNYYTLFNMNSNSNEKFEDVVIECIQNLGEVKNIGLAEANTHIEYWIQTPDKECFVGYLFVYDEGVVECQ